MLLRLKRLPPHVVENVKTAAVLTSAAASLVNAGVAVYRLVSAVQESGWL